MRRAFPAPRRALSLRAATFGVIIAAALVAALLIPQQILAARRAALHSIPAVHVVRYDHTHHSAGVSRQRR
jgi:hypothetical protein